MDVAKIPPYAFKRLEKDENEAKSFASYVSDGSRILSVTFPDENRRTRIDENTWKVELLPFDFLGNKVVVRTTIALIPNRTDKSISINAKKLEFEGMPKEFNLDETVTLKMEGKLGEERSFRKRRGTIQTRRLKETKRKRNTERTIKTTIRKERFEATWS